MEGHSNINCKIIDWFRIGETFQHYLVPSPPPWPRTFFTASGFGQGIMIIRFLFYRLDKGRV